MATAKWVKDHWEPCDDDEPERLRQLERNVIEACRKLEANSLGFIALASQEGDGWRVAWSDFTTAWAQYKSAETPQPVDPQTLEPGTLFKFASSGGWEGVQEFRVFVFEGGARCFCSVFDHEICRFKGEALVIPLPKEEA